MQKSLLLLFQQRYLAYLLNLEKIYTIAPSFRAEKSKTSRHLTEYWHAEMEVAWADFKDIQDYGEGCIKHVVKKVLEANQDELRVLERDAKILEKVAKLKKATWSNGICSNCGNRTPEPTNFCQNESCRSTFITNDMVKKGELYEYPLDDANDICEQTLKSIHETRGRLDNLEGNKVDTRINDQKVFKRYSDDLGFKEDNIRGKSVLDIGAGSRKFAGYCIRTGLNENVHSIEPNPLGDLSRSDRKAYLNTKLTPTERAKLDINTTKAEFPNVDLEDGSFDLIVSRENIPSDEDINPSFDKIYDLLKVNGEARMHPIFLDSNNPEWQSHERDIRKKLDSMKNEGKIKYSFEEIGISNSSNEMISRVVIKKIA